MGKRFTLFLQGFRNREPQDGSFAWIRLGGVFFLGDEIQAGEEGWVVLVLLFSLGERSDRRRGGDFGNLGEGNVCS